MSIEENKAVVGKFLKACRAPTGARLRRIRDASDPAVELEKYVRSGFSQVLASSYVDHGPRYDVPFEELIQTGVLLMSAFPDLTYEAEDMVAVRDKVVARYTAHGTHLGQFVDVPPSGKKIEINGIYIGRVAGGKIAEGWYVSSFFSGKEIFEQLRLFLLAKSQ